MKKILHIEDNEAIRQVLAVALAGLGYSVTSAANGRIARDLMAIEDFDIIITDHHMPEMGGLDVVRGLVARHAHPQVIVTSADLDCSTETEYRRLYEGISILQKPYRLSQMALTLNS